MYEIPPWRSTRFSGANMGQSRALVTPDSLSVVLEFHLLLARIFRRQPPVESVAAEEVVDMRLVGSGRRRVCLVVAGSGYQRREMRLSPWVFDAWIAASPVLRRRFGAGLDDPR